MKRIITAACISGLLFAGCEEKAPFINIVDPNHVQKYGYTDSLYSLKAPAADKHNVLMEEFTGASCTNCPAAHELLGTLENLNEGRINTIGLYLFDIAQTVPPKDAAYDFRDSTATDIGSSIYGGINALPNGGIDRSLVNGSLLVSQGNWSSTINDKLSTLSPINMTIASSYGDSVGTIKVALVYASTVSAAQNLSIVIVEDSNIDKQENPPFTPAFPTGEDDAYVFTNVFRQMVSAAPLGDPIYATVATKTPGLALTRTYTYKLKSKVLNPAKCRVIAFVSNTSGTDKQIVQSVQTRLK